MGIKHQFVSAIPDSPVSETAGHVMPSHWNDTHTIPGLVFVSVLDDLPEPVSGVITLADNVTYYFTSTVDLLGARLVCGQNTTLIGGSSENSRLLSTGLVGTALITSSYSLPIRSITITANIALNVDGGGTAALDWFGVNFQDCPTIGVIRNVTNFIAQDCAVLNSANFTFGGTLGTVGFTQTLFIGRAGQTIVSIEPTAVITRRFRITYSAMNALSGETAINVPTGATIPVEGYILDTVNFSGGGTYTAGVQYNDNKALFVNNRGINNSATVGYMTMQNNATATTITTTGVPVKLAGTTALAAITQKFTHTSNRLTYTGALPRDVRISATSTLLTTGAGQSIGIYIAKNGSVITESKNSATTSAANRAENLKAQTIVNLVTGDYIEIFGVNDSAANNITSEQLSVIIEALN